jgi:uncharacterized membrane protein
MSMAQPPKRRAERRWPMAAAVMVEGIGFVLLPQDFRVAIDASFVYPLFLLGFLVVLIVGDPGRIDRQRRWLRITTGLMIASITLVTAYGAVRLVVGILTQASFDSAGQLLAIGGIIWVSNVLAYALWYWDLDAGGAAARANTNTAVAPAFVFPESSMPEVVGPGWYPQFVDYLALSFNTALAFSPTDVSAIRPWAKLMMISESLVSLAVGMLVIAYAINIL